MARNQGPFGIPRVSPDEVVFDTGNGQGSANTKVRLYTNIKVNGDAMYAINDAALGSYVKIRIADYYSVQVIDLAGGGAVAMAIARGQAITEGTTSAFSMSSDTKLVLSQAGGASVLGEVSVRRWFNAGDIIWHHGGGTVGSDTSVDSKMVVTRG